MMSQKPSKAVASANWRRFARRRVEAVKRAPVIAALWRRMMDEALRSYLQAADSRRSMTATPRFVAHETVEVSICLLLDEDRASFHCLERLVDAVRDQPIEILAACLTASTAARVHAYFPDLDTRVAPMLDTAAHDALARRARGDALLFLFGTFEVAPSLGADLVALARDPRLAESVFGGAVIDVQGHVRQAGVAFESGRCVASGVDGDASKATWQAIRTTGGFAGAPLAISRLRFEALGGLRSVPANPSFLHLCLAATRSGMPSRLLPALAVIDWASTSAAARRMRTDARPTATDALVSTTMQTRGHRILVLEDRIPHVQMGRGYPRSREMVASLVELGHRVTFYPMSEPEEEAIETYATLPRDVELIEHTDLRQLARLFRHSLHDYDVVVIARPYNMRVFRKVLGIAGLPFPSRHPAVIYDAEALFSLRDIAQKNLADAMSPEEQHRRIADEIALTEGCAAIFSVSTSEAAHFEARSTAPVFRLAHALRVRPTTTPFEARRGYLFVGALFDPTGPNVRALLWFLEEVLPLIRERSGDATIPVFVAGGVCDEIVQACATHGAQSLGIIDDLSMLYETTRVFIAPSLFAAGIPLKVLEAAAMGMPAVASTLLARQLAWEDGTEILSAETASRFATSCTRLHEDAKLWDRVRAGALKRVHVDASPDLFRDAIKSAIEAALVEGSSDHPIDPRPLSRDDLRLRADDAARSMADHHS